MAVKRPVFVCVLALILGEFLAFLCAPVIIFLVSAPLFLMQKIITKKWNIFFMVIFLFIFLGFCVTKEEMSISEKIYRLPISTVNVTGRYNKCEKTTYGYKYEIENVKGEKVDVRKLIVYTDTEPDLKPGNIVRITGEIDHFQKASNYGNFDGREYYKSLGIYVGIKEKNVELLGDEYSSFKYRMQILQKKIKSQIDCLCNNSNSGVFSACNSDNGGIYAAIITGDKSDLNEEIKSLYQVNGISHILAISGLHISTIGIVIYKLLRKRFKFALSGSVGMLVVIGFVFMTGEGISSIRAAGMFTFYLFSQMMGRKYDMLSAMSFMTIMVCLTNPFIIMNSGFQMSFGAILGILFINPVISGFLGINNIKPISQKAIESVSTLKEKIKSYVKNIILKMIQSLIISFSINLVLVPILVWNYYQISIYSLLINLLVIPLMTVVITSGIIGIIIAIITEGVLGAGGIVYFPRLIMLPGCLTLEWYETICNIFAKLPGNILITGKPAEIQIATYYIFLVIVLVIIKYLKKKKNDRQKDFEKNIPEDGRMLKVKDSADYRFEVICIISKLILLAALSVSLVIAVSHRNNGDLNVYFNDVGQGDCIVLQKDDFVMMIDGGSTDVKEVAKYRIKPLLKARGISKIDYVVVTHADSDHISGIVEILQDKGPDRIVIEKLLLPSAIIKDENRDKLIASAYDADTKVGYI